MQVPVPSVYSDSPNLTKIFFQEVTRARNRAYHTVGASVLLTPVLISHLFLCFTQASDVSWQLSKSVSDLCKWMHKTVYSEQSRKSNTPSAINVGTWNTETACMIKFRWMHMQNHTWIPDDKCTQDTPVKMLTLACRTTKSILRAIHKRRPQNSGILSPSPCPLLLNLPPLVDVHFIWSHFNTQCSCHQTLVAIVSAACTR